MKTNIELIKLLNSCGEDVFIGDFVEIKIPEICMIGSHVAIDNGFKCSTGLLLGDYIHIAPDVIIIGGKTVTLEMGHFSFIAAGTKIVCGSENYVEGGLVGPTIPVKYRNLIFNPVKFEAFAGTGVNCCVMPGVILGEGSVIGANSVVTKKTEPWTVYVGSPARPIRKRDKETALKYANELGYQF